MILVHKEPCFDKDGNIKYYDYRLALSIKFRLPPEQVDIEEFVIKDAIQKMHKKTYEEYRIVEDEQTIFEMEEM